MYLEPIYTWSFIALSIFITHLFLKKTSKRKGCISYAFFGVIIMVIIISFITSWAFMIRSGNDLYNIATSGKVYAGTVISFTSEDHYDSEENRHYTMYKPTVQFTVPSGKVIETELEFSTSSLKIGDIYKVNFNEENGRVITLGFSLIIRIIGSFIFTFLFTFLFAGLMLYVSGRKMEQFYSLASKAGYYFFIPFLMIGFNTLLIYAFFYGNSVPFWAKALIVFFSISLALGTWGYLKMILSKGRPKMKRISANKWVGDWRNENGKYEKR